MRLVSGDRSLLEGAVLISTQPEVNDRIIPQMTIVIINGHENPIAIIAMSAPPPMRHAMPRMVLTSSVVIDGTSFSLIRYAMQPAPYQGCDGGLWTGPGCGVGVGIGVGCGVGVDGCGVGVDGGVEGLSVPHKRLTKLSKNLAPPVIQTEAKS
jgi:hypothetical protein